MKEAAWCIVPGVEASAAEFPIVAQVEGEDVVVFRAGRHLRAIGRWCPHRQADLAEGRLMGDMIKCPLHGYIFRLSDGRGVNCMGVNATAYEALVDGSDLKLRKVAGRDEPE